MFNVKSLGIIPNLNNINKLQHSYDETNLNNDINESRIN